MASNKKLHNFEDVVKHNDRTDCWLIVHGKVYDVTTFLDDHPGGDEVLLTSTDKTADFEDVGHSDGARELMGKYCIGEIDKSTIPVDPKNAPSLKPAASLKQSSGVGVKILQFLLPFLILGIAYALKFHEIKV